MTGEQVVHIYNKMILERGDMSSVWRDVIRFCYPQERSWWGEYGSNDRTPGRKRGVPVSSYPALYAQRLGSALTNSAFPSNGDWFDLSIGNSEGELSDPQVKRWCREARDLVQFKMRQGSNFYQEVGTMMHGLATLGTAGFYTYYKDGMLKFRYVPIHKNLYIARNSDGEIDMVAILHEWTAKEAIEEYGRNKMPDTIINALENGFDAVQTFKFVQLIYPKKTYGERYDITRGGKPYGNITVEYDSKNVVAETSNSRFPMAVPRFYVASDDLYGGSPAMVAMPLIRATNTLRRTILDAATRAIKPPVFINSINGGKISLEAGAINRIAGLDPNSIWTYPAQANFQVGQEEQINMNEELKHAFLIDIFQAIDQTDRMTATEVTERVRQKMEAIAPVVARIHKEFSSVVVLQCLELLFENGEINRPPVGDGAYLQINYLSALDAMLGQGKASKTMTFIAQTAQLLQLFADPDISAVLDKDAIITALADGNMLPANYLRKPEERDQIRQQQAEAQAQAQQAQQQALDSQSSLNMAKANQIANNGTYNGAH